MIGLIGRQGPAATLRQRCPQMTRRRCHAIGKDLSLASAILIQNVVLVEAPADFNLQWDMKYVSGIVRKFSSLTVSSRPGSSLATFAPY